MSKKMLALISIILLAGLAMWYINNPAYEKRAEDRIHKYMEAQGIDQNQITTRISQKDVESGDWLIFYQLNGDDEVAYEYRYDKRIDAVLLIVYEPDETEDAGKQEIKGGMDYPPLSDDWVTFDEDGHIQLPQN